MPRTSERKKVLNALVLERRRRSSLCRYHYLLDMKDEIEDELDNLVELRYEVVYSNKYFVCRQHYRQKRDARWRTYLSEDDEEGISGVEFLEHFRVTKDALMHLSLAVENDAVFEARNHRGPCHGPPSLHLLVLLKYIGIHGSEASTSKIGHLLGISKGRVYGYLNRAISAVLNLKADTVFWPDAEECREICGQIEHKFGCPNCVGFMDGTLIPLAFKPGLNGEDHFSRKCGYALNVLITCDDLASQYMISCWGGLDLYMTTIFGPIHLFSTTKRLFFTK